jgi:hypothetical protein
MFKRKHGEIDNSDSPILRPITLALPTISPTKLPNPHPQAEEGLLIAASSGDINMVRHLLSAGVDVNCQDKISGKTPLMRALWYDKTAVAQTLITQGADLKIQDNFSNTALFIAAARGNIEIVKAIIAAASIWEEMQYKAFLDQPHRMYGSSLQVALESGDAKIVKVLVDAGATVTEGMYLKAFNIFSSTMHIDDISIMLRPDVREDKSSMTDIIMSSTVMLSDLSDDDSQLSGSSDQEAEY